MFEKIKSKLAELESRIKDNSPTEQQKAEIRALCDALIATCDMPDQDKQKLLDEVNNGYMSAVEKILNATAAYDWSDSIP